jgi:hypothetical protein
MIITLWATDEKNPFKYSMLEAFRIEEFFSKHEIIKETLSALEEKKRHWYFSDGRKLKFEEF